MKTFVPMLPEQIPQQRLNEVLTLPSIPSDLKVYVDNDVPLKKNRPHKKKKVLVKVTLFII